MTTLILKDRNISALRRDSYQPCITLRIDTWKAHRRTSSLQIILPEFMADPASRIKAITEVGIILIRTLAFIDQPATGRVKNSMTDTFHLQHVIQRQEASFSLNRSAHRKGQADMREHEHAQKSVSHHFLHHHSAGMPLEDQ